MKHLRPSTSPEPERGPHHRRHLWLPRGGHRGPADAEDQVPGQAGGRARQGQGDGEDLEGLSRPTHGHERITSFSMQRCIFTLFLGVTLSVAPASAQADSTVIESIHRIVQESNELDDIEPKVMSNAGGHMVGPSCACATARRKSMVNACTERKRFIVSSSSAGPWQAPRSRTRSCPWCRQRGPWGSVRPASVCAHRSGPPHPGVRVKSHGI